MNRVEISDRSFDLTVPLIIIGGGAAGMVAALTAKAEGLDPLVLERDPLPRGSTALSAGLIPAAGTRWQKAAGISDAPEIFAADILQKAHDEPDPALVQLVTQTVGPTLEWLADTHGLPFSLVEDFRYPGHSQLRMHGLPSRSGGELIDRLRSAAEQAGIDILTEAHVETLVVGSDGKVRGVILSRPDGTREEIGCEALILACNGYGGNPALVEKYIPQMRDALYFGHPGNQGDALLWGEEIGAATHHLGGHQGHGSVAHPAGILITWATVMEGGFQVTLHGARFSNEAQGYSEQAANVLAQPESIAWTVFDQRIAAIAAQFEDFREAERLNAVISAETIEELAGRMQVDPDRLAKTFAQFEACKVDGSEDDFDRGLAGISALQPPFRAVKVTGALFHTQGGLVVDGEARVLREDGSVIANLFAAGGAACGVSGSNASGYLSGNGLLTAVALGRVSALSAAKLLNSSG
ncbi:FAD-dependent oxidoreductase [Neorhizobium alkalisoli]|uniref:Fumarate reductase flavoprotein subunit n=1 Tax=Neorhizobium alkalisoli TaxID=528178 RepID=A0A561R7E4_9HYPH|nr:FAD-dependent oxidoreductase [Neorhizobium alkalisoli]TWF58529.1 fumarate reductase flavoprotein subunit [Neorhizobium alkalisoli]